MTEKINKDKIIAAKSSKNWYKIMIDGDNWKDQMSNLISKVDNNQAKKFVTELNNVLK
jgi:hypothetical protein